MIDLHSHILPRLDDGAESAEIALSMARSAVAAGIRVLAATPHVRSDYPTTPEKMERRVRSLRESLEQASVPLEVLPGGEIALEMLPNLRDDVLRRFGLGGNPRFLLLEMPAFGWPLDLEDTILRLRLRGFESVLAHPERNFEVQDRPDRLAWLVEAGTIVQITAASVDGRLGPRARKTAFRLITLGLVHMLAGDAHAPTIRQIGMTRAVREIGDRRLARWLTEDVPGAIVDDSRLPARPPQIGRRFRFHGLRST